MHRRVEQCLLCRINGHDRCWQYICKITTWHITWRFRWNTARLKWRYLWLSIIFSLGGTILKSKTEILFNLNEISIKNTSWSSLQSNGIGCDRLSAWSFEQNVAICRIERSSVTGARLASAVDKCKDEEKSDDWHDNCFAFERLKYFRGFDVDRFTASDAPCVIGR